MPERSSSAVAAASSFVVLFFAGLFIFAKWGPAIPFYVSQVTTAKNEPFTVSADGKAFAQPDVAQIELGFTTNGSTVSQVQSQANKIINSVAAAVKGLGVEERDIRTTNYNLRPDYNYTAGHQSIIGYVADINLEVKVRDFSKINQVIDAATANGANQVGGLSFTLDDATMAKVQSQARAQAIENAKKKAAEIAGQTGMNLGRIINVSEEGVPSPRPLMIAAPAAKSADGGAPTQVQPGQSEISVSVALSYETR